ncbi:MAG TPA: alkaline phosphatase family protein [Solirubrobacteraceae bacterium]|nr:alkaline phosphatase family protein [Solirubrobacteraceae bacterium]
MSDVHEPQYGERLEAQAPEEYLRRRDFLARTAAAAGVAGGLASVLGPDVLVAEAARRQRQRSLPSPRNLPIDTFVVLMMENRSFDHYLGWLPGADGRQAGLRYADKQGKVHQTRPLTGDFQGCGHPDPDHSWKGGRIQLAGGRCDGFLQSGNDDFAISYYKQGDLGFIQDAAKAFTVFDRFHCSLMGSTLPNREYMHAGESYGQIDNNLPPQTSTPTGFPDNTIFAALAAAGVSNRYFFSDVPVAALWGAPGLARSGRVDEYYQRCQAGTLPSVSFVDPNFGGSAGEGPGVSADEHPHGDVRAGQAFMSDVVHAFMESPQFARGALFIVYDEWGGFFDHVRPPRVPDQRNSRELDKDYGLMGFRIPALVASPWVRRGHVEHSIYGFESILKMISYRFALAPLNRRVAYARNIARSFDFESKPRLTPPSLPHPAAVMSQACPSSGSSARSVPRPKDHDMMDMVYSGYLERLGFHYRPAGPSDLFREPHRVVAAHRAS